jgi:hypothetical protein
MTDNAQGPRWNPVTVRRGVLGIACVETAFIFFAIQLSSAPASPVGPVKLTGGALIALLAFFLLVLPAWLLAWFNRALPLAVTLVAVARVACIALLVTIAM